LQKYYYIFLLIIFLITSGSSSLNAQSWYDYNWTSRNLVTITNPGATPLTDYQVKISLTSSTFNFSYAKSDGSDIRITANDSITPIPFWIENWTNGVQATIWVKVPSIPTSGTTVFIYYGNNSAASVSNGSNTFQFFDDFESWTSATSSTWQDKAPMPTPIADIATAVYNGKIYSIGGYGNGPGDPQNKNYEYDPAANTWAEKTPMPTARWGMMAVEFNGLIYVFGGSISSGAGNIAKNEAYNPVSDSWTTKTDVPSNLARQGVMGIKYGDKIHMFYLSYHYEYDPTTDIYTQKADVPNPRMWSTVAVVGSKIYLIGGTQDGVIATNNNQEYDPATDTWAAKSPFPGIRWGMARENPVINGKIYASHGLDGNGGTFHTENYAYDPATDTWVQKGPAAHARDGVGCGIINNKIYIIGGRADFGGPYGLNYNEVYDPSTDTWSGPQPGPSQWTTSGTGYVFADGSAKYSGNYGLVIQQTTDVATQRYAQTAVGLGSTYALDFNWQITDAGGINNTGGALIKPQGLITLTETDAGGSIFFYEGNPNVPVLRWYTGSSFTHLQNSTWNTWHNVTVVRNGASSQVTFDGNQYQSPIINAPPSGGLGKIKFGVYFATTQYIDNVRVRKWSGVDPSTTIGALIQVTGLPVELSSFAANVQVSNIKLNWETSTEKNSDKFVIERKTKNTDWKSIGSVKAAVLSNSNKYYSFTDKNLQSGQYNYRLKMIDNDGTFKYSKEIQTEVDQPKNFELSQNFPNPWNPSTKISYTLSVDSKVTLKVYNIAGEMVGQLVNEEQTAGYYTVDFGASKLSSGVYFYRMTAAGKAGEQNFTAIKKMTLLK
jgi:hypothetical protein